MINSLSVLLSYHMVNTVTEDISSELFKHFIMFCCSLHLAQIHCSKLAIFSYTARKLILDIVFKSLFEYFPHGICSV